MKRTVILILAVAVISCRPAEKKIADANDYNAYLAELGEVSPDSAGEAIAFWNRELKSDSTGIGALGSLASAYTARFKETGNVEFLHGAQTLLEKGIETSAHNKDVYMMSLAANFISQHRFREAKAILKQAGEIPSNKRNLELALYDVEMELGNYNEAYRLLQKNSSGHFSSLVRKSKWADHAGKLSQAIQFLEEAKELAFAGGDKVLKAWTLTSLADYYGHAGEVEKSYSYYLRALELEPANAYALKGIAWINYSHDKNYDEASRILTMLIDTRPTPDYYLFRSEIAEARGLEDESDKWKSKFLAMAELPKYGRMYNTYLIEAIAETSPELALERVQNELAERKTPEIYALYAYSLMEDGKVDEALQVMEGHVIDQTYEPVPTYYAAKVLAAAGQTEKSKALADDLNDAAYELGPLIYADIMGLIASGDGA